jgi:diguanylate cyclase (GGDEF)-like protein
VNNRKIFGLIALIFLAFFFCVRTITQLEKSYHLLIERSQVSAWSLTIIDWETTELTQQLEKYITGVDTSQETLNLKYNLTWNSYSTFLTSRETQKLRDNFNAGNIVSDAFRILRKYEPAIQNGNLPDIKQLQKELQQEIIPNIHDLMVIALTSHQSDQQKRELSEHKTQSIYFIIAIFIVFTFMTYLVYKDAKAQHYLAWNDPLTNLYNRNYLLKKLERIQNRSVHLILFDIRGFKEMNDRMGYDFGDTLLQKIASQLIRYNKFNGFFCSRIGTDEFGILIDRRDFNIGTFTEILWIKLDAIIKAVDPAKRASLSMGVASTRDTTTTASIHRTEPVILNNADLALNIAQKKNYSPIVFFDPSYEIENQKRRKLTDDLNWLLKQEQQTQLYLCFQPITYAQYADKLGGEALIRWEHPVYGKIPPQYLVSIAEESGLGKPFGIWLMKQIRNLLDQDLPCYRGRIEISMNLSDSIFIEDLPEIVEEIFSQYPEDIQAVIFEITENMTLDNLEKSRTIIQNLRKIGIRCALDDFGTGWSSMYNLKYLHFDKVKIDRAFVTDIHQIQKQYYFTSSIVTLTHQLGMTVVAEGIESEREYLSLRTLGVDEYQGYYFSIPLSKTDFIQYCKNYLS